MWGYVLCTMYTIHSDIQSILDIGEQLPPPVNNLSKEVLSPSVG